MLMMAIRRGGARKRTHQQAAASSSTHVADIAPANRSAVQWAELSDEVLNLACLDAHLAGAGPRESLIARLVDFYRSPPTSTAATNSTSVLSAHTSTTGPLVSPAVIPPPAQVVTTTMTGTTASHVAVDISSIVAQEVRRHLANMVTSTTSVVASRPSTGTDASVAPSGNLFSFSIDSPVPDNCRSLPSASASGARPSLPAVPRAAIDKIKAGEYVNFDVLLPNYTPMSHDEYAFQLVGGADPSVCLVPKNQAKPKVSNFNAWMVAWSNFMQIYTSFWPHRVGELITYQSIICDFASQFSFSAWVNYDRMFRFRMAQDPLLSWSITDDDLLPVLCALGRKEGNYNPKLLKTCSVANFML